jgi:hypothetical protein
VISNSPHRVFSLASVGKAWSNVVSGSRQKRMLIWVVFAESSLIIFDYSSILQANCAWLII